jgi:polar amino acid transport system substrate-binding protein
MKILCSIWLILAVLFDQCQPAQAGEAVLQACMIDQEPWGSLAAPEASIYGEVFREIGKEIGLHIDVRAAPLVRTLDDVRTGACQFTITSWQPARADKLTLGAAFATIDYGILPRRGLAVAAEADLHGHSVALVRGLLLGGGFDGDPAITRIGVYGYEQAVLMTASSRADAAAGSIVTLNRLVRQHGVTDKLGPPLVLSHVTLAVQMNNAFAATGTARKIDEAVDRLRQSGQAGKIIARHFGE